AAVVPLHQVGIDLRDRPPRTAPSPVGRGRGRGEREAGQLARLRGAPQGAGEDAGEREPAQPLLELAGGALPALLQRPVRPTRSLARVGPGRVAVPGDEQPWQLGWHGFPPRAAEAPYTLSPSVEVPRAPAGAFAPHFQPLMAGMSSPCRAMYSLCSIS